jgi:RimJ/RimL family protein N-acetyltransferase
MNIDTLGRPVLTTERLALRAMEMCDCPRVAELAGDKRIYDMTLLIPHPYALKQAEDWIGTHAAHWARWREDWTMNFAIRSKENDTLMGAIGLVGVPRHKRAEMGYWLGAPFWGNGFMTEAARAVVEFAFGTLGANRLEAGVFDGNTASMNVLRKSGFIEEGVLRQRFLKDGKFVDERMFGNAAGARTQPGE